MEGRRRRWFLGALMIGGIHATCTSVAAQDPGDHVRIWMDMGISVAAGKEVDTSAGLLVQLALQKRQHRAMLRGLFLMTDAKRSNNAIGELGVLFGRARRGRYGHAAISTGVSLVALDYCPGPCRTVGVPIVAELTFQAAFLGAGLQTFCNLNPKALYGGVALSLQLGWI